MFARRFAHAYAAEHGRDCLDALLGIEALDLSRCRLAALHLAHGEVLVGQGADLRQVGDAKHLGVRRQCLELPSDQLGHATADTSIDLVEYHD